MRPYFNSHFGSHNKKGLPAVILPRVLPRVEKAKC